MKKNVLKLKSLPAEIHRIERFVEDICDEYNINNTYFGNILIALTEAVENAMNHGNKLNPDKYVTIVFESQPKGLLFEVTDEGNGFDIHNIPDATDVENNPDRKGSGIYLMKSLSDEFEFKNKGRTVRFMFYISSINQQMSLERARLLKMFKKEKKEIRENKK